MNAPHILHVCQPVDGGVARYVAAVCTDQLGRGWQVSLACPASALARQTAADWWHWPANRSPGLSTAAQTVALARIISDTRPDVVHLHSAKAGLAGRLALRGHRPTIFTPHGWSWLAVTGTTARLSRAWERHAARWTHLLTCVGQDEQRIGAAAGITARTSVIRNGVDRTVFAPASDDDKRRARAQLGVPTEASLVVCAGRVTRQKGQDVLLAAWPAVLRRCPSARLAIVGDGDPDLLAALRALGLDGVTFADATTDVRGWLAAADVVTVPSRWEGTPLVALEAIATGRSIVASSVGGLPEILDATTGALVPAQDPSALADALADRLGDPRLIAAESEAAAAAAPRFDQRDTLDRLATLTAALADPSRRPPRPRRPHDASVGST